MLTISTRVLLMPKVRAILPANSFLKSWFSEEPGRKTSMMLSGVGVSILISVAQSEPLPSQIPHSSMFPLAQQTPAGSSLPAQH
jgi:hypothetical protein